MSWLKNHSDFFLRIVMFVLLFVLGGSGTVGIIILENPFGKWLKGIVITEGDIIEHFEQLQSYHANTAVMVVKTGGIPSQAKLQNISIKANLFFGKRVDSQELLGKSTAELIELLSKWMEKADYEAFKKDQARLFGQYSADEPAYAQVPVKFNDKHPTYKNGIFLPVIISLGPEEKKDANESEQLLEITYLDLKPLIPVLEKYAKQGEGPQ